MSIMRTFRTWLENNLRREQQAQLQKIYDMAVKTLLGSARDQTHLSLSDIEDDGGPGSPPSNKGALVAMKKLQKAQIFDRMKQLGDPETAARAADAENFLQKAANDQVVGPQDTVGQLLNKMFGDDAVEIYGNRTWETTPQAKAHRPDDNEQPGQQAVAPPMSAEQPPAPAQPAPQAPAAPPMGGQPPMPPMGGDPMGGMPQQPAPGGQDPMAAMMQPPQQGPQTPLQSPGGPMPPKPPGGLAMA